MKIPGIAISLLMLLSNSSAVFAQMPAVSGNICAVDLGMKIVSPQFN